MKRSLSVFLGAVTIGIVFVFLTLQPKPLTQLALPGQAGLSDPPSSKSIALKDVSLKWRLIAGHRQTSMHLSSLTETLGAGICIIDANQDGWMDLFIIGGSGHTRRYGGQSWWHQITGNRLLLNNQGEYFVDVTEQSGLDEPIFGMACTVSDFNNDGKPDLFISTNGQNTLFKNIGGVRFVDVTPDNIASHRQWSTGASIADFDGDGLIDIYVSNYVSYKKGARTFNRSSGFNDTLDVAFDPTLYDPSPNRLYRNTGGFQFEEIAQKIGVSNSQGRSLGARWLDINEDSWPDLLVLNESGSSAQLYVNNNGKSFSRRNQRYAAVEVDGVRDVAVTDIDNDGTSELVMSRTMGSPPVLLKKNQLSVDVKQLYRNVARTSGLAQTKFLSNSSWGLLAADFNNDSLTDLYWANGNVLPDSDTIFVAQAQANRLLVNSAGGSFSRLPASIDRVQPFSSRSAISADFDNDGSLEVIVSNNNDPVRMFQNTSPVGQWLGLDFSLIDESHRYGAKVEVRTKQQILYRTLQSGQSFLSQGDSRLHIGLGSAKSVLSLTIKWRNGDELLTREIKPNHYYRVNSKADTLEKLFNTKPERTRINAAVEGLDASSLASFGEIILNSPLLFDNGELSVTVWNKVSSVVKLKFLNILDQKWYGSDSETFSVDEIQLARTALLDKDKLIRVAAIELLQKAELEISTAWLIPLLSDEESSVQCAAAHAFGFWFGEEEAVSHRKMLAYTPLLKMLDGSADVAVVCAIKALAAAESKRAVLPLMQVLRSHKSSQVKAAAIDALGLIRDVIAVPIISETLKVSANPRVIASSLIALSRLKAPQLDKMFKTVFSANSHKQINFNVLHYLFSDENGTVFPTALLIQTLQSAIETETQNHQVQQAAIKAMGSSRALVFEKSLVNFIEADDPALRVSAFVSLALLNTSSGRTNVDKYLLTQSKAIISEVVTELIGGGYIFSQSLVVDLFNHADFYPLAIEIVGYSTEVHASKLFDALLPEATNHPGLSALLGVCVDRQLQPSLTSETIWLTFHNDVIESAMFCLLRSNSSLVSAKNSLGTDIDTNLYLRKLLHFIDSKDGVGDSTKTQLLINAAERSPVIAKTMLEPRFEALSDSELQVALQAVESSGTIGIFESKLLSIVRNSQRDPKLRWHAARMWVEDYVQSGVASGAHSNLGKESPTTIIQTLLKIDARQNFDHD